VLLAPLSPQAAKAKTKAAIQDKRVACVVNIIIKLLIPQ
jgi:hypothetical protein